MGAVKIGRDYDKNNWSFNESTVYRGIQRVNRNIFAALCLLLAFIILFDVWQNILKYQYAWREPVEVTPAELAAVTDPLNDLTPMPFNTIFESSTDYDEHPGYKNLALVKDNTVILRITGSELSESGITVEDSSGYKKAEYKLLTLGDKKLFVKQDNGDKSLTKTGTMAYLPSDIKTLLIEKSGISNRDLLPLFMNATGDTFESAFSEWAFTAVLLLAWAAGFFFLIRRLLKPDKNPTYRELEKIFGTVEQNAKIIDEELSEGDCERRGATTYTENWVLTERLFSFEVKKKDSL